MALVCIFFLPYLATSQILRLLFDSPRSGCSTSDNNFLPCEFSIFGFDTRGVWFTHLVAWISHLSTKIVTCHLMQIVYQNSRFVPFSFQPRGSCMGSRCYTITSQAVDVLTGLILTCACGMDINWDKALWKKLYDIIFMQTYYIHW